MRLKNYNIKINPDGVLTIIAIVAILAVVPISGYVGFELWGDPISGLVDKPISDPGFVAYVLMGGMYILYAAFTLLLTVLAILLAMIPITLIFDVEKAGKGDK